MKRVEMKNGRYESETIFYNYDENPSPKGTKVKVVKWYKNDLLHREDGPALTWTGYTHYEFYLNGIEYTEEEFNHWLAKKQLNEKLQTTLQEKLSVKKSKI